MKAVLETFKPIKGYEGLYEISDYGCVRSLKYGKVRYLKLNKNKHGYVQVALRKNGKTKFCQVHRLEWEGFYEPIPSGMQIDHINTVRDDNRLENLRVVTPKENSNNPITADRLKEANRRNAKDPKWRHRQREGAKKLSEKQEWQEKNREAAKRRSKNLQWRQNNREANRTRAKAVLQLDKNTGDVVRRWECIADAERELGISHISACCLGKCDTTGGYCWRFENECESAKQRSENQNRRNRQRENKRKALSKPVLQLDKKTGEVIRRWECIKDAARKLKISAGSVSGCCHGKGKSAYGFRWRFDDECESAKRLSEDKEWKINQREGVRRACAKPVLQLDKDTGLVVRRWECIADAARELGFSQPHISECCHGEKKTAGGYRWKFATGDD